MSSALIIICDGGTIALDSSFWICVVHGDEAGCVGKWKRAQQDGIDHRKNCEVRAEAHGESEKRRYGEARRFSEQTRGVGDFAAKLVEKVELASFTAIFLRAADTAEFYFCAARGLLRRNSAAHEIGGVA